VIEVNITLKHLSSLDFRKSTSPMFPGNTMNKGERVLCLGEHTFLCTSFYMRVILTHQSSVVRAVTLLHAMQASLSGRDAKG
jgi:hypothetical protein